MAALPVQQLPSAHVIPMRSRSEKSAHSEQNLRQIFSANLFRHAFACQRVLPVSRIVNAKIAGTKEGSTIYLDPQGSATRAQVAAILSRYAQNIVK